jgi:ribosomal protein L37AE/L43A
MKGTKAKRSIVAKIKNKIGKKFSEKRCPDCNLPMHLLPNVPWWRCDDCGTTWTPVTIGSARARK